VPSTLYTCSPNTTSNSSAPSDPSAEAVRLTRLLGTRARAYGDGGTGAVSLLLAMAEVSGLQAHKLIEIYKIYNYDFCRFMHLDPNHHRGHIFVGSSSPPGAQNVSSGGSGPAGPSECPPSAVVDLDLYLY
jgi:hypothetical protein